MERKKKYDLGVKGSLYNSPVEGMIFFHLVSFWQRFWGKTVLFFSRLILMLDCYSKD